MSHHHHYHPRFLFANGQGMDFKGAKRPRNEERETGLLTSRWYKLLLAYKEETK
jgi:hypothetical protein